MSRRPVRSRRPRALLALLAAALFGAPLAVALAPTAGATDPGYTVQALRIKVVPVRPGTDTTPSDCADPNPTVAADIYTPTSPQPAGGWPSILTTNGFGGSKSDQAGFARSFAQHGYVVLSYSGLGFGGSSCRITLDDPDHDGYVGSQLVSFLGGKKGMGFRDAGTANGPAVLGAPYDVTSVQLDNPATFDPRVGMIGGSYGGQIQFSIAGQDPRLDTIIPLITWNDLSYSLAPNNTSLPPNSVRYRTPGTEKFDWTGLFTADGVAQGVAYAQQDPADHASPVCPNFDPRVCPAKAELDALGYPTPDTVALARHASVDSYIGNVRIPTFLAQGEADTLFNLQESLATYHQLRANGNGNVKLLWQSWGHSNAMPVPGELDLNHPEGTYEGDLFQQWFDHYLKGTAAAPPNDLSYFRDYAYHAPTEAGVAAAYATTPAHDATLYLSGEGDLVASAHKVHNGAQSFAVPPAGAPTSYSETSGVPQQNQPPPSDTPGTFAAFTSPPLTAAVDQVGVPRLRVRLDAPSYAATQSAGPAGQLVVFAKVYDVAPDGTTKELPNRLIAPVRVTDVTAPVDIQLPGVVHQFQPGHRLQLVLAAGDAAYKGNAAPGPVTVVDDRRSPNTLTVPLVSPGGFPF